MAVVAKAAALKAEAAVQAAPFSAVTLMQRAQVDSDWAAILDALRLRRRELKAARVHVAQVVAAQPEAAERAAVLLQAAWQGHTVRVAVARTRHGELLRAVRVMRIRLRGGGLGDDRVLRPRMPMGAAYNESQASGSEPELESDSGSSSDDEGSEKTTTQHAMADSLTEGGIVKMFDGEKVFNPVVQITSLKALATSDPSAPKKTRRAHPTPSPPDQMRAVSAVLDCGAEPRGLASALCMSR